MVKAQTTEELWGKEAHITAEPIAIKPRTTEEIWGDKPQTTEELWGDTPPPTLSIEEPARLSPFARAREPERFLDIAARKHREEGGPLPWALRTWGRTQQAVLAGVEKAQVSFPEVPKAIQRGWRLQEDPQKLSSNILKRMGWEKTLEPGKLATANRFARALTEVYYETYGTDPLIFAHNLIRIPAANKAALYNKAIKLAGKRGKDIFTTYHPEISPKVAEKVGQNLAKNFIGRQMAVAKTELKGIKSSELRRLIKHLKSIEVVGPPKVPLKLPIKPTIPTPKAPTKALVPTEPPVRPFAPVPKPPTVLPTKPPIEKLPVEGIEGQLALANKIEYWKRTGEWPIKPTPPKPEVKPPVEVKPAIPEELEPLAREARKYKTAEKFRESLRKTPEQFKKVVDSFAKYRTIKKGEPYFIEGSVGKTMINDPFQDFYNQALKAPQILKPTITPEKALKPPVGEPRKAVRVFEPIQKSLLEKIEPFQLVGKPKAMPEKKWTPAEKLEMVGKQPATQAQKASAHILARKLKLIVTTPTGKISFSRYRRLAKGMTGKSSIRDMTREEADDFINAIQQVVQRRPWEPPIIPISTKIVPKEFFEMQFKQPGLAKFGTPKKYYLRLLGSEPIVKPTIDAFEQMNIEKQNWNRWLDRIGTTLKKQATLKERIAYKVFRRPTTPQAKIRNLLDTYKETPDFLAGQDAKMFTELRGLTKNLLERTNVVRVKLGLEPIKDIGAYVPHFLDEMARQIVQKKYPFPEDVKYWLGRNMPAKIYNPTAMERRVKQELNVFFSRDITALMKALVKYDLRDIYLSEPYSVMRAQLNALGDKIPKGTRETIDEFMRYDVFKYPTELDRMINANLEKPTDIINKFLRPMNRIITNPIRSLSSLGRRLVFGATIWGRPKLAIRNAITQKLLTLNLYPIKHYLRAQFWPTPKKVMQEIRDTTFYKLSRRYEDIPEGLLKVEFAGMLPYQKSHAGINYLSNVDVAMKVGYYYGQEMVKLSQNPQSRLYKHAVKYSKKYNKPLESLLWNKDDVIAEAVESGSLTQWLYFSTDMPWVFRGYAKRGLMSLQSWWQNFFFKHQREALSRMISGITSRGKIIKPSDRINWLKGTIILYGIFEGLRKATGLDYRKFVFLWGPAPVYLSPQGQIALGVYKLIVARTERERKAAISQIRFSYKAFIPGSLAWKDLTRYLKGETDIKEFLFYTERKGKPEKRVPF